MLLSDTQQSFIDEMHMNLDKKYNDFNKYQCLAQETLSVFHKICESNCIDYYLAHGSLLGAVRDNGQIPWDYDIDVWVRFEDSQKLIKVLENELGDNYTIACKLYNNSAYHYFLRVTPNGYSSEVLHVDVFWLSATSNDIAKNEILLKRSLNWGDLITLKHCDPKYRGGLYGKSQKIIYSLCQFAAKCIPDTLIDFFYREYYKTTSANDLYWTDNIALTNLKPEWFASKKLIKLKNGESYYIPNSYSEILKSRYGNYMSYLPIDSRMKEFHMALIRLEKLGKNYG